MRSAALLLAAVVGALPISSAKATIRLAGDRGGLLIAYAERFSQARARGERVVIDGNCLSACTLAIGLLPRGQVCATSRAVLGFHAAWRPTGNGTIGPSPAATQAMFDAYPAEVQNWISSRGGLTPRMLFLRGRELAALVPSCEGGAGTALAARRVTHGQGAFASTRHRRPAAVTKRPAAATSAMAQ
jgi:hypothetical protein